MWGRGPKSICRLTYDANIGFGIDRTGFFFLNDTDMAELSIDFLVDAGSFEGSMEIAKLLKVTATAVDSPLGLPENTFITPDEDGGLVRLTASLEADLFGNQGSAEYRDFSGIHVVKFASTAQETVVTFEKSVRLNQLKFSSLVSVAFVAEADINLQLRGEVLNPINQQPILMNGASIIPTVVTELVIKASVDTSRSGDIFILDEMMFNDLRVDVSQIYLSLMDPIISPISPILKPLSFVLDFMDVPPINILLDAVGNSFPILKIPITVAKIANDVIKFC